jgi:predicted TPR repeat methyltransferase
LLVGIDISQAMLDRINSNSKYDELHCAEILTHLKSEDRTFDLIYAASVSQFLNPTHLSQVSHLVRDSLTDSGEFVFTFDLRKSGYGLNSK